MQHSKAVMMVLFGATCMSFAALFVRAIETNDGFQIIAYRSIGQCFIITLVACLMKKTTPWRFFASLCVQDIWIGGAMGLSYCFYVFALLNTSVASALFILSIGPVFAAVLAWMFLGAPPTIRATISIIGALIGVGIMMLSGADLGRGLGNFYAVLCAFFFAVMLVIARGSGRTDVLSGNFLGAFFAMIWMGTTALVLSDTGLRVSTYDLTLMISMGVVTIGMGMAMVARASPFLPPAELSVLMLVESLLAPLWVWGFMGEALSWLEVLGGTVLLASVVLLVWRRKRKEPDNQKKSKKIRSPKPKHNFYTVLGVSDNATDAEIKRAYHKKAKEFHPDQNKNDPKAATAFKEITEAYESLKSMKA